MAELKHLDVEHFKDVVEASLPMYKVIEGDTLIVSLFKSSKGHIEAIICCPKVNMRFAARMHEAKDYSLEEAWEGLESAISARYIEHRNEINGGQSRG